MRHGWTRPLANDALDSAFCSPYALDELVGMGQFLVANTRRGRPSGAPFSWVTRCPGEAKTKSGLASIFRRADWFHTRLAASPYPGPSSSAWFSVSGSCCAGSSSVRNLRWPTTIISSGVDRNNRGNCDGRGCAPASLHQRRLGLCLVAAPWLFAGATGIAATNSVRVGLLLVGISMPRGTRSTEHYGGRDRYVV